MLIEAKGRPFIFCPRCRTNVVWPHDLQCEQKNGVAAKVRSDVLAGVTFVKDSLLLEPREAKALCFHITRERGRCHRCNNTIEGEASICTRCNSVNLDW